MMNNLDISTGWSIRHYKITGFFQIKYQNRITENWIRGQRHGIPTSNRLFSINHVCTFAKSRLRLPYRGFKKKKKNVIETPRTTYTRRPVGRTTSRCHSVDLTTYNCACRARNEGSINRPRRVQTVCHRFSVV